MIIVPNTELSNIFDAIAGQMLVALFIEIHWNSRSYSTDFKVDHDELKIHLAHLLISSFAATTLSEHSRSLDTYYIVAVHLTPGFVGQCQVFAPHGKSFLFLQHRNKTMCTFGIGLSRWSWNRILQTSKDPRNANIPLYNIIHKPHTGGGCSY